MASKRALRDARVSYVLGNGLHRHRFGINKVLFDEEFSTIVTLGRDSFIRLWKPQNGISVNDCEQLLEGHTHWVNDGVFVGRKLLATSSSDTRVLLWDLESGKYNTIGRHEDYAKCISFAAQKDIIASGGFDKRIRLWDLHRAGQDAPEQDAFITEIKGHPESIYSLDISRAGDMIAAGSTDRIVHIWDSRSIPAKRARDLRGHLDTVRAVKMSADGRMCLTGSSDHTIRLWDIGTGRCIHTFTPHEESVWALQVNDSFTRLLSGGRDGEVYLTDVEDENSVLSLCGRKSDDSLFGGGLWCASTESSVHYWDFHNLTEVSDRVSDSTYRSMSSRMLASSDAISASAAPSTPVPYVDKPMYEIQGDAGITRYHILNDRVRVLTMDTSKHVRLYNLLTGGVVAEFGLSDFEEKIKELYEEIAVPLWFSLELRMGALMVHLDPPKCFAAESYLEDCKIRRRGQHDEKLNVGQEVLRALFRSFVDKKTSNVDAAAETVDNVSPESVAYSEEGANEHEPTVRLQNPETIYVIVWESGDSNVARIAKRLSEYCGKEPLPVWVRDAISSSTIAPGNSAKVSFILQSDKCPSVHNAQNTKLSAHGSVRIGKILHYVRTHVKINASKGPQEDAKDWSNAAAEELFELYCNDCLLINTMTLATVRQFKWKNGVNEMVLTYKLSPSAEAAGVTCQPKP